MSSELAGLTSHDLEHLDYIISKVPEWPDGAEGIWAGTLGGVYRVGVVEPLHEPGCAHIFTEFARDFTRAQYEARKAQRETAPELVKVCPECGGNGAGGSHEDDCNRIHEIDYRALYEQQAELVRELVEALEDCRGGLAYIRGQHGDLYGVGFDRAEQKAVAAISKYREQEGKV